MYAIIEIIYFTEFNFNIFYHTNMYIYGDGTHRQQIVTHPNLLPIKVFQCYILDTVVVVVVVFVLYVLYIEN